MAVLIYCWITRRGVTRSENVRRVMVRMNWLYFSVLGFNLENNTRMNECPEARLGLEWNNERGCDEDDDFQSSDEAIEEGDSVMRESDDAVRCCSRCSCVYGT